LRKESEENASREIQYNHIEQQVKKSRVKEGIGEECPRFEQQIRTVRGQSNPRRKIEMSDSELIE